MDKASQHCVLPQPTFSTRRSRDCQRCSNPIRVQSLRAAQNVDEILVLQVYQCYNKSTTLQFNFRKQGCTFFPRVESKIVRNDLRRRLHDAHCCTRLWPHCRDMHVQVHWERVLWIDFAFTRERDNEWQDNSRVSPFSSHKKAIYPFYNKLFFFQRMNLQVSISFSWFDLLVSN